MQSCFASRIRAELKLYFVGVYQGGSKGVKVKVILGILLREREVGAN